MSILEADIEQDAVDLVWKYLGIEGSKLAVKGDNGYPDRVFWVPGGRPLLIEFKAPGERPRPKQQDVHVFLRALKYEVQVHDNAIDAFEAVINFVEATRLSKESRQVLARARRRCAVLRSGVR